MAVPVRALRLIVLGGAPVPSMSPTG